jgi:4-diphosphocytidyl-2-C-methyl-D-erythritol kinase
LIEPAPAKVNLTLRVLGRRPDGFHEIESLVAFARIGDRLELTPGRGLELVVRGPNAPAIGALAENLVLRAARALAKKCPGLPLGRFVLLKRLPVAAGLGGGSADAAAALRLLARAGGLAADDPRLMQAAGATGADVPVCLGSRACIMRGVGHDLSAPVALPKLPAVLVNPGLAVATSEVFARRAASPISSTAARRGEGCGFVKSTDLEDKRALFAFLAAQRNELEPASIELCPAIAEVLAACRATPGSRIVRMSGSGPTCFALFDTGRAAQRAARMLRAAHPRWWVRATELA